VNVPVGCLGSAASRLLGHAHHGAITLFDTFTLDQLRALLAVVEEGSFSAAARKLKRVQSAVSTAMLNLETQLGVTLWDRSGKTPKLTEPGRAVVRAAERVLHEADALRRLTSEMNAGLEASVSLCVDAALPISVLIAICAEFMKEFPGVDLRVDTQIMSAVAESVLKGNTTLGIATAVGLTADLKCTALAPIHLVPVVGARHPLAAAKGRPSRQELRDTVQIVLTERSETKSEDYAVLSPRTYRVADLHTKVELLRANLGWGHLPVHLVEQDLLQGNLVALKGPGVEADQQTVELFVIHRQDLAMGPAHRWISERVVALCFSEALNGLGSSRSRAGVVLAPPSEQEPRLERGRARKSGTS
jgi:DNA-binding transcriptional LysR family regulator